MPGARDKGAGGWRGKEAREEVKEVAAVEKREGAKDAAGTSSQDTRHLCRIITSQCVLA